MLAAANLRHVGLVIGGCNAVGYAITAGLETHKITDLVGVGSFVVAALSLSQRNGLLASAMAGSLAHPKLLLINVGVAIWGGRLASYLFSRVLQVGEDKRLHKFFRKPGEKYLDPKGSFFPVRLSFFWSIQAAWGFLCMLPVTLLNSLPLILKDGTHNPALRIAGTPAMTALALLPIVGLYSGILIESLADWQKSSYRNDKKNDGHWCDKGMWKYSRYPNYFGELLTWWSIYFGSMSALLAPVAAEAAMIPWAPLVGLLSPAFVTLLLLKVSGIPLLEAKYKKEYKGNVGYQDYVSRTPLIVPNPFVRSKKDD
ncbi:hypothetical protein B484DRAFT_359097 [Ochromonadaceae sp. CCMP2298]|nr:hypothetical protein B484DRAFT_359097 [Ochromonadaceae sp. CCMP2298]|mmetsp:Transcript_30744/g.69771  ORF Transcript_30744/g.69771 Transcript_30744/m.69771 type:complete len:313 (+) Transcript_30744:55-993(+)